jgi:YVTN family beta-propeller protein
MVVGLATAGLSVPALAQSVEFPTYQVGAQQNGTFVVSDGTIITPAGTQVNLGIRVRAKAVAVNPTGNHTAAVLTMGTSIANGNGAVEIFNTQSGDVIQSYSTLGKDAQGSNLGITYTPDGKYLLFSQDSSFVGIASVSSAGTLTDYAHVSVPMDVDSSGNLTTVTCYPYNPPAKYGAKPPVNAGSPPGTTGSVAIPCGQTVSIVSDGTSTSYPTGIAVTSDAKTAYVVLNNNDTLTKIDLTQSTPVQGAEVRVGQVPHSVVISPDGKTAYVSNEAGRIPTATDFQGYSNGTPVVAAYPTGSTEKGTISVVDLASFTVTGTIEAGLHPTGMAFWGKKLLVTNTYSDNISVIDTTTNREVGKIDLGLPIGVPGELQPAYGAGPNSIAVDAKNNVAYVALYNANAVAVVDLNSPWNPIRGMIPTAYAPSSVALDTADDALIIANDKGWGTTGNPTPAQNLGTGNAFCNNYIPAAAKTSCSVVTEFGVSAYETHQDLGTVSIVPVPKYNSLASMTRQVYLNNHWDLEQNIKAAGNGNPWAKPTAIPAHIGDPSKIKHVFVIIRENRTYDQMLGDVTAGNGDPSLAVFGDGKIYAPYLISPNAHALVQRFPLFDNFYDPSRQSADGHNWIVQAMAPYSDDIQSPDWIRDYPSNGGDAIAYQKKGHLWDAAARAGVSVKNYGEYVEYNTFTVPGCTNVPTNSGSCEPTWTQFYNDVLQFEKGSESQLTYYNTVASHTPLPILFNDTVQNYPQFDLGIPDQFRFDIWRQDFDKDVANGTVPQLEMMWISSDHTGGPPSAAAMQADNDLALGRFVDAISHSAIWSSSAIFVEEDDAQTGVDHVDGHRSPGYVISPYVKQQVNSDGTGAGAVADSTFYTQVAFTRTIEQILGIKPMNQFDLVASPLREIFIDNPPKANFLPWTFVPNDVPLCMGVTGYTDPNGNPCPATESEAYLKPLSPAAKTMQAAWLKEKAKIFAGKYQKPDSEDTDIVKHYDWYEATGFSVPFPGEKTVRTPNSFKSSHVLGNKTLAAAKDNDGDDD